VVTFWLAAAAAAGGCAEVRNRSVTAWTLIVLVAPAFLLTLLCLPALAKTAAINVDQPKPADDSTSEKPAWQSK
jgi:hypothetical protein